jgi:hypothetical protein
VARSPFHFRGGLAIALAAALAAPTGTSAARRAQEAAATALAGTWTGSAVLTNDAAPASCRYEGGDTSTELTLEPAAPGLRAIIRLEIPGTAGSGCPPLLKRYETSNVVVTGSAVSFIDPAGHEWTLALREGRLTGLVAWKGGGKDEPLAEGYAPPGASPPLTRLGGEVRLTRAAGATAPPATGETSQAPPAAGEAAPTAGAPAGTETGAEGSPAPAAGEAPKKGSSFWLAFIGANIVGIGAFYGIKKLTDDDSTGGSATCSPRFCVFSDIADPCVCNINITSGASCGSTSTGVPFGGVCNDTTLPCQAGLSCNNGVCDDRVGRCPF